MEGLEKELNDFLNWHDKQFTGKALVEENSKFIKEYLKEVKN